jgi:hypothetical protein
MKKKLPVTESWTVVIAVTALLLEFGAGRVHGADCNANHRDDLEDISSGASQDCNANAVPDECELSKEAIAFERTQPFETGQSSSLVTEDFDGDGDLDMVLAELDAWAPEEPGPKPAIVFLRNLGLGLFADPVRHPLKNKPYTVHAADLDGDGDRDLLAIFPEDNSVGVLLNRGDGTLENPVLYAGHPYSGVREVMADLDGDQDLDIVAPSWFYDLSTWTYDFSILFNRGDGTFDPGPKVAIDRARYFKFADLDGDGDLDIALDTAGVPESPDGALIILLNDGAGGFPAQETHAAGQYPHELSVADLDGDGDSDVVVTCDVPSVIAVFKNRGDGRFDAAPSLIPGHKPTLVTTADVDGDGDVDLLSAAGGLLNDPVDIALFINRGGGTFAAPTRYGVGAEPSQIEVRDLNGDGLPEILVLNYFSGNLSVFRNRGGGAFEDGVKQPIRFSGSVDMRLADLDADGDLDVATAALQQSSLVILQNVTGGAFAHGCNDFRRGDVNTDGVVSISDIVMLRRFLFEGNTFPACLDAADATDNDVLTVCDAVAILDVLFRNPGWQASLPAPSPEPGRDPTPLAEPSYRCDTSNLGATGPLGCLSYDAEPPEETPDVIRIGDVDGIPGAPVKLPVYVTSSVSVDALQLVVSYDPDILEIAPEGALSFESTYLDGFENPFGMLTPLSDGHLFLAALAGNLLLPGSEVPPGDEVLVAWINARVKDDAPPGLVSVDPTNGPDGAGTGPFHLRNELTHKGSARFVSLIPRTVGARLNIVGDQSLFVRADANGDWKVDISDAIHSLRALFLGGPDMACKDAADANDDGRLDISDAVFTLEYLFSGTRKPLEPFPDPGTDPTEDALRCFRASPPAR